jgi:hypothetical protein
MVLSLEKLCIKKISNTKITNLNDKLNSICYDKIVDYQIGHGLKKWKAFMLSIKIELNIKDIEASYDMFLDEPTYFIFVKKRMYDDDDEFDDDDEYEIYRNDYDTYYYDIYYDIAKKRGLIE